MDPEGLNALALLGMCVLGYETYNNWDTLDRFADKYLGENADPNLTLKDALKDVRPTGKDVFPTGITHPGLGLGTKAGQTVGTAADIGMEVVK